MNIIEIINFKLKTHDDAMADRLLILGDALNHDKQLCIFKVDISLHWILAINIGKVMLWLIYWYVNNVPISLPIGAVLKHNMG
jgi:hypothetical protein